jgi:DNA-binding transcriptional ArsR family regulator
MRRKPDAARSSFDAVGPESLRRRILEYIAQEGGELRSDSGQGLRRQICDALDERPTRVSGALIALERGGLLEREMDAERRRCHAIRLIPGRSAPPPMADRHREGDSARDDAVDRLAAASARKRAELEAAEREFQDLILRAADASRRVGELRRAVLRGNPASPPIRRPPIGLRHEDRDPERLSSR